MSLEIKNLSINIKINPDAAKQESSSACKEEILKECRQLIKDSACLNNER